MKLNITIDVDDTEYLQDEIITEVSNRMMEEILGFNWEENKFTEAVEHKMIKMMDNALDADFKKEVSEKITENLTNKFERTKQYKELINGLEIENDKLIKTGLKGLVADLVRVEMKNMFTNK